MPFKIVSGEFVPDAGRPDGDSVRFRPDDPNPLFQLPRRGRPPRVSSTTQTIQLRFEGIDTMESKALDPFSSDATASNLELCGVAGGIDTARGHIMANQIGPNGRPICFVYPGDANEQNGESVFLNVDRMKESINFQQIVRGHAYPLFYDTLFFDLRNALAEETKDARNRGVGVWSADVSMTGATYENSNSPLTMQPLFPKLWRRLDTYSRSSDVVNNDSLIEFKEYLETIREERVLLIAESRMTGFDDLVEVDGNLVKLISQPEDMVVVSI
jgi:endonuclease YncB( thermonuclease family)